MPVFPKYFPNCYHLFRIVSEWVVTLLWAPKTLSNFAAENQREQAAPQQLEQARLHSVCTVLASEISEMNCSCSHNLSSFEVNLFALFEQTVVCAPQPSVKNAEFLKQNLYINLI